jgi:hypothetical protein
VELFTLKILISLEGARIVGTEDQWKKDKEVTKMPAKSIAMGRLARLAENNPEKVYPRNRSILKMKGKSLHDYASTPEKGLPYHKKKKKGAKK